MVEERHISTPHDSTQGRAEQKSSLDSVLMTLSWVFLKVCGVKVRPTSCILKLGKR